MVNERHLGPNVAEDVAEDLEPESEEEDLDDSDISLKHVLKATHWAKISPIARRKRAAKGEKGGLATLTA